MIDEKAELQNIQDKLETFEAFLQDVDSRSSLLNQARIEMISALNHIENYLLLS